MTVIGLPVHVVNYASAVTWIKSKASAHDAVYAVEAANTHVAALARHEQEFGEAMSRFDLICPDGMPLVWSLNAKLPEDQKLTDRVYGPTLMKETIAATQDGGAQYRHFLLGGKDSTLVALKQRFAEDFPEAAIAGMYSPPFGQWSREEFEGICRRIRESGANLIWVGLGCPKQEKWIAKHKSELPNGVYFGIGAAFAFHAGEVRQAPAWVQRRGLEWAYRLCMEPRRLFRRYFLYNSLFLIYFVKDRVLNA